jgi:RNA polymerase sigma-70 factor, ECF subfamily
MTDGSETPLESQLLRRLAAGEQGVEGELYERVYADLRERAQQLMNRQRRGHTLQPTALVHEAWLRIADHGLHEVDSSAHFFRLAARAMRSVLVDHARARVTEKRGGGGARIPIEKLELSSSDPGEALLSLHESLERLQASHPDFARVAEMRLFAGLGHAEIAAVLGVSTRTVERSWRLARAWMQQDLDLGGSG